MSVSHEDSVKGSTFVNIGRDTASRAARMQDGGDDNGVGRGTAVITRTRTRTKKPSLYRVLILNDDYTPMEFVIVVLQEFFSKDRETATQIMLKIHLDGKGVCGVYSRDVAATKVEQVLDAAVKAGHPLQCVSEPVE